MSLRTRIVSLIGLVLLVSLLVGALVAGLEARRTLREELQAALAGGEQTAAGAFEDLPRSDHPDRDLRNLVATFDGNRHLRAVLRDGRGTLLAASRPPGPLRPVPGWFARRLGPPPASVALAVPPTTAAARRLELEPLSGPDVEALWRELLRPVLILSGAALLGLVLVFLAMGAALRPVRRMSAALAQIGGGDYGLRLPEQGPPELASLQRAFNQMAAQLAAMQHRNETLETQLATIQDEERAELARDLHDDMGPHLFSVAIDAQLVGGMLGEAAPAEARDRLRAIQEAVAHMQRLVRDILGRLRPTPITELGLAPAIDDLAAYWRARRPEVEIEWRLAPEEALPEPLKETAFRVIQEGLSNAMRHAEPARVRVSVQPLGAGQIEVAVSDDGRLRPANPERGFGLAGLRERVHAVGGRLAVDRGGAAGGWTLTASLPVPPLAGTATAALSA